MPHRSVILVRWLIVGGSKVKSCRLGLGTCASKVFFQVYRRISFRRLIDVLRSYLGNSELIVRTATLV